MAAMATYLTGNATADALLDSDLNALLIGMLLDQQVPMEKAFSGPKVIAERMGGTLDVAAIAAMDEEEFVALCAAKPAIHRYPGSMGKRVHQVCKVLVEQFDGSAENVWVDASSGDEVWEAVRSLPGFGDEKAAIFTALLGKQRGVTPLGWRDSSAPYGEDGVFRWSPTSSTTSPCRRCGTKRVLKLARKAAAAERTD